MATQLTLLQFRAVQKMLRSGVRHCEIARATGLSVWTISRIASDHLGSDHAPRDDAPHAEREEYQPVLPEDDAPPDYVATNLRRCPGCGGMVYQWPCLTCQLRTEPLLAGTKPCPGDLAKRRQHATLREQVCSRLRKT